MRADISEIVDGRYLEPILVPPVVCQEATSGIVSCKTEALIVGDLGPYIAKILFTFVHGSYVSGLVHASCSYNHKVVGEASWFHV